jgi:hypothetical protein
VTKKKVKPVLPPEMEVLLLKNRVAKLESFCSMFFAMWSSGRSAEYAAMTRELERTGANKKSLRDELAETAARLSKLERKG